MLGVLSYEIARQEKATTGSVPLTTLQADVNYGYAIAFTTYGTIGVKVWIYRGMYGEEVLETDVRPGGPRELTRRALNGARGPRTTDGSGRARYRVAERRSGPLGPRSGPFLAQIRA
jgi:ribosomal protein S3